MKTYKITILYMAGNSRCTDEIEVKADHMSISTGAIIFYNRDNEVIASYPVNCTILNEVKKY